MAGVLVAIDWENIRRALPTFVERVTPERVCQAFQGVATGFGDYRGGVVFGDWTLRPEEARKFESYGLQALNVLRSRSGKDRSDPAINLEVYDWLRDRADVATVILGSGDSDFQELIRRARDRGKKIVICAFGDTIASDLKNMTPIFPLEAELGLTPKGLAAPSLPGTGIPEESEVAQVQTFVQRMDGLERALPYVVLNYLRTVVTPAWGVGQNEAEKDGFLRKLISAGVLETFEVINPKNPGHTARAVRLNRNNELVQQTLPQIEKPPGS